MKGSTHNLVSRDIERERSISKQDEQGAALTRWGAEPERSAGSK
jgi:hypothetical protein